MAIEAVGTELQLDTNVVFLSSLSIVYLSKPHVIVHKAFIYCLEKTQRKNPSSDANHQLREDGSGPSCHPPRNNGAISTCLRLKFYKHTQEHSPHKHAKFGEIL
jgi:hypothetical protein